MAIILVEGEKIQWHLPYTTHDTCPKCGGRLGLLKKLYRACMGTCPGGQTWELKASVFTWLELIGFDREEIQIITARPGDRKIGLKRWARLPERVRPGFLADLRRTNPSTFETGKEA